MLVMVGDEDDEIPIEHTLALRGGLPNAQLAVLAGAGHGGIDTRVVLRFLSAVEDRACATAIAGRRSCDDSWRIQTAGHGFATASAVA